MNIFIILLNNVLPVHIKCFLFLLSPVYFSTKNIFASTKKERDKKDIKHLNCIKLFYINIIL